MLRVLKKLGRRRVRLLLISLTALGLASTAVITTLLTLDSFRDSEPADLNQDANLINIEIPDGIRRAPPDPADLEPPVVNPYFTNTYGEPVPVNTSAPVRIVIEDIDVDAPVSTMGLKPDTMPEVPQDGETVAWYDFSPFPGQGSNAVLAGHVSWDKETAVFWALKDLRNGSAIRLVTDEGNELIYRVFDVYAIDPDDPDSVQVMDASSLDMITLISCGGRWLPNPSEPLLGSYSDRVIVQASLQFVNDIRYDVGGDFIGF